MIDVPSSAVSEFRQFNRVYTRFLGTLRENYHDSPFSLTEARILYEIGNREESTAAGLCSILDLDPGYLSRQLRRLNRRGLIAQIPSRRDRRSRLLVLKPAGQKALAMLGAKSDAQARELLETLSPDARNAFLASLTTIRRAITREPNAPLVLRPHRPGDLGWVVHREGELYGREYGWDESFEGLVARIVGEFAEHYDPARERCWIAEMSGERVGHVFLVKDPADPSAAKLRLLLVEPSARGRGVGRALVQECVRFARSCGYRHIRLWTQSILTAAHRIYREAGFSLVSETPHRSFGHELVGQTWELRLSEETPAPAPLEAAMQRPEFSSGTRPNPTDTLPGPS